MPKVTIERAERRSIPKDIKSALGSLIHFEEDEEDEVYMVVTTGVDMYLAVCLRNGYRWNEPTNDPEVFWRNVREVLPAGSKVTLEQE